MGLGLAVATNNMAVAEAHQQLLVFKFEPQFIEEQPFALSNFIDWLGWVQMLHKIPIIAEDFKMVKIIRFLNFLIKN